jgi:hypothetical protein
MDDDKLHTAISRGQRAKLLLDDELLQETFRQIEADFINGWKNSKPHEADGRERVWQALNALGKVRDYLSVTMTNGKHAQRQLDELMGRRKAA